MWIWRPDFAEAGKVPVVVARAKGVGLTHIFVRTGSTWDGLQKTKRQRYVKEKAGENDARNKPDATSINASTWTGRRRASGRAKIRRRSVQVMSLPCGARCAA